MQKTNFKTRLLALLTAAFMIVMCVPFAAFADDAVMTINFYVDSQPVGSDSFKQEYGTWTLRDALEDDSVIPEGKELTGWVPLGHSEVTLKPGTSYSWDELSQYAQGGTLTLDAVFEAPKPATKPVYVSYILESGEPLANATEQIELENGATTFSSSLLKKVPAGYELCETGDVYIGTNDTVNVKVREVKKPAKVVYVSYILESGEPLANATEQIELENGATTFSTSLLKKVPAGYELCETGDVYIGTNDTVNVKVREIKKPAKVVYVSYILESGEPLADAIEQIELENGATTFSTSLLKKVPAGYELCETGDVYIGTNDTVNVKVREIKKPAKVVYVSYILESGEPLADAIEQIELENGATTFSTSLLKKVPAGYELCETGDVYIGTNDTVNVKVREVKKPEASLTKIKMIFTKADGATSVFATGELTAASEWYVLPDAAGVINLTASEKLTGWTLFQNGAKYAAGEKVTFESLKELAGKNVDKDGVAYLNFYADLKTDVELKNITIKYVEDKDGAQEDVAAPQNNFTAKDEFTILTDNLYDGKVPAGKKLIGWQYKNGGNTTNFVKGEHVKFDTLKALLNGNWDNEGNAWVTLTPVFQDVKSNNGNSSSSSSSNSSSNSSSSSSSSSNKTTTASNEKQVVKAAAAPANTTKVLPKTGATNAAPLIGGSLAVVALLMGYGVYGLVLRKKD
ncbi:hypothetical protein [Gemmiger formicilis]|uniref:hypothetical protein n=2 Tax=Gemmiger formicilis TaxID=745368 RepID=UPI003521B1C7